MVEVVEVVEGVVWVAAVVVVATATDVETTKETAWRGIGTSAAAACTAPAPTKVSAIQPTRITRRAMEMSTRSAPPLPGSWFVAHSAVAEARDRRLA
ncbi:hypothetical protein KSP35_06050 [Aquihabitans sp. G128]|uniref:hypothetical protein n=1 Tax=Aquihabitans sp. G128 TaxID=2849779 RepID=UPI001C24C719|nr:hypothetical protein [Aquihabitans sp. G128]QXC62364.1 hypothetical protein KSP35_06050 [Aquihabitans sp. G128]